MVFELEEGRLMGPPEILHTFYFRFALWPRDISIRVVLEISGLKLEGSK